MVITHRKRNATFPSHIGVECLISVLGSTGTQDGVLWDQSMMKPGQNVMKHVCMLKWIIGIKIILKLCFKIPILAIREWPNSAPEHDIVSPALTLTYMEYSIHMKMKKECSH